MSLHSYSRVWLHLVWATLERRSLLTKVAAAKLSVQLTRYAGEKGIYMKINFVNPDHVHALVDLPTGLSIEEMMQYIAQQEEHHRQRGYSEQVKLLVERYGLKWRDEKTVETVSVVPQCPHPAEAGC